jgi:hypothetical protein
MAFSLDASKAGEKINRVTESERRKMITVHENMYL